MTDKHTDPLMAEAESLFGKMREATPEETEGIRQYILQHCEETHDKRTVLTDSEREICKMFLEDLDHNCNEYKLLMRLIDESGSVETHDKRTESHSCDYGKEGTHGDVISRADAVDARRYTFGNDEFSLEAAYHDCKLVFDGITDDDSFQEADTGLILYYANEIIYALQEALEGKDTNVPTNDCISRAEAIDAIRHIEEIYVNNLPTMIDKASAQTELMLLPSAQPNLQPTCNQLATSCISRQAAIDLAKDLMIPGKDYLQHNQAIMNYEAELVRLPSAEPEIIRCQYCKHNTSKPNAGNASCELFYGMSDQYGFCHRAERREDEDLDIS